MSSFNLRDNAFHLLRVNATTPMGEIASACEDAILDGRHVSEDRLAQAQKSLTTPKLRLVEEVSGILDTSGNAIDSLIEALEGVNWRERLKSLSDLSKGNGVAHRCGYISKNADGTHTGDGMAELEFLVNAQHGVDPKTTMDSINEARSAAGNIPLASETHIKEALKVLRERHRSVALDLICASHHPGEVMTRVAQKYRYVPGPSGSFIKELVRSYDGWSAPRLRQIEDKIDKAVARLKTNPNNAVALVKIKEQLAKWDEYSQPSQLIDEAQGLDEDRSRKLFEKLRGLALELANEQENYEAALKLTTAMLDTFPELPAASELLAKDMSVLKSNAEAESGRLVENKLGKIAKLMELVEWIRKNPEQASASLTRDAGAGIGLSLRNTLEDIVADPSLAAHEGVWLSVRGVAVELHNKHHLSLAAMVLTRMLFELAETYRAPQKIKAKLSDDSQVLNEHRLHGEQSPHATSEDSSVVSFLQGLFWFGVAGYALYRLLVE